MILLIFLHHDMIHFFSNNLCNLLTGNDLSDL